jgi:hypothetical protein
MSEASDKPTALGAREPAAGFRHWMASNAWRFVLLFAGVLLPLAGFVALADEVHELEAFYFDAPLLLKMHAVARPSLDAAFVLISKIGYQWGVIPADILIVVRFCCCAAAGARPVSPASVSPVRPCSTWAANSSSSATGRPCGSRSPRKAPTASRAATRWAP